MREKIRFIGKISNATISRVAEKWFISFRIKPFLSYLPCKNQASVRIDLGIKYFAVLSNGSFIDSLKPLKRKLKKVKRLSKQLSRKQHPRKKRDKTKISNNFKKLSLKIANIRNCLLYTSPSPRD
jgi:putative transposase